MKKISIFFLIILFVSENLMAKDEVKISNIENLKLLQDQFNPKNQTYSYEINERGLYFEPQAVERNSASNSALLSQELRQEQDLNYDLKSNIGYDFSKYFTGFVTYDLGNVGVNANSRDVNFGVNPSTIKINGIGSKIKFSDDFGMKVIYYEQDLNNNNGNSNIDKSQEINLKTILNF